MAGDTHDLEYYAERAAGSSRDDAPLRQRRRSPTSASGPRSPGPPGRRRPTGRSTRRATRSSRRSRRRRQPGSVPPGGGRSTSAPGPSPPSGSRPPSTPTWRRSTRASSRSASSPRAAHPPPALRRPRPTDLERPGDLPRIASGPYGGGGAVGVGGGDAGLVIGAGVRDFDPALRRRVDASFVPDRARSTASVAGIQPALPSVRPRGSPNHNGGPRSVRSHGAPHPTSVPRSHRDGRRDRPGQSRRHCALRSDRPRSCRTARARRDLQ